MPRATKKIEAQQPAKTEFDPNVEYSLAAQFSTRPERMHFAFWIIGTSPLICHAFPQKAKAEILAKQVKAKVEKKPRKPEEDYLASLYPLDDTGKVFGFPVTGVKKSFTSAANKGKGLAKAGAVGINANLWLNGKITNLPTALDGAVCSIPLCRIWSPDRPQVREDWVKLSAGVTSLGYRGQFDRWAIRISGHINPNVISAEALLGLANDGGSGFGLGDWRNEKGGVFGAYRVGGIDEEKDLVAFARGQADWPAFPVMEEDDDAWMREAA